MAYVKPHIGNLRKRAKALGRVITKTTNTTEAYYFGFNLYVLHAPHADYMSMRDTSLNGIRAAIEELENNQ